MFWILQSFNAGIFGMGFDPYLPNDTVYVCYITDLSDKDGEYYIEIKPIQFLWGLDAVIEGKKDGAAEYSIDPLTKDTNWYVPNDYYINYDSNSTKLKIRISGLVKVSIYENAVLRNIALNELLINPSYYKIQLYDRYTQEKKESMDYYPYEIAVENGKVSIIREIYVP